MTFRAGDLDARVRALEEMAHHLHDAITQVAEAQRDLNAQLERVALTAEADRSRVRSIAEGQQGLEAELRELTQALMPLKEQVGRIEGRMAGKREAATLLVTAFLSALWVLISVLNLQVRLRGE
ncbi:MAG: hypothetical protein ACOY93_07430 [Bacillota bacterium]